MSQPAQDLIRKIKLDTNALMAILYKEYHANSHPDVKRMFYRALEQFEDASLWAVKGMSSEYRTTPPIPAMQDSMEP